MIVVSDTTALTTLIKAGLEESLPALFGAILIPSAVASELLAFHETLPGFCEVKRVADRPLVASLCKVIDAGEAEAIALALEEKAQLVLIDDRKGRRQAEAKGLVCVALPAILVAAKRQQIIPSLREAFEAVAIKGNYRVASDAAAVLLNSVGEA